MDVVCDYDIDYEIKLFDDKLNENLDDIIYKLLLEKQLKKYTTTKLETISRKL